jgi:hypothetical protein
MEEFTVEQMQRAEMLAVETGFDNIFTSVDALSALVHCLFCVVQGTTTPQYTEKQMSEAGVFILQHYPLSENFPYSNREIIKDILKRKSRGL